MVQKTSKGKKLPEAPLASKGAGGAKVAKHPFFEKAPRRFDLGGAIQPKRDLTRFVRWPKYIRLQRQRKILMQRLKVPPALNHFNATIDKNQTNQLMRLLNKYKPETRIEKKGRLMKEAEAREAADPKSAQQGPSTKKPVMLKFGLNHVTDLVEMKRAKLVVIANDVDPIELVCWLPALCRKKDTAYCIVKGKARLGQLVHQKTAAVIAIDNIRKEDQAELDLLCRNFRAMFNDNVELRRRWGGGVLGVKAQHAKAKKDKLVEVEAQKKLLAS